MENTKKKRGRPRKTEKIGELSGRGVEKDNLTTRQRMFVELLPVHHWIGSEAVKAAGYRPKNDQIAAEMACELLKKTKVAEAVAELKKRRLKEYGIEGEAILLDRRKVAKSDVRSLFRPNGTLKQPEEWSDEIAGAIAGLEVIEIFENTKEGKVWTGYLKKVKLNDRNSAQHDLMEHAGLFPAKTQKVDIEVNDKREPLSNLELASKVIYYIQLMDQRQRELEDKQIE